MTSRRSFLKALALACASPMLIKAADGGVLSVPKAPVPPILSTKGCRDYPVFAELLWSQEEIKDSKGFTAAIVTMPPEYREYHIHPEHWNGEINFECGIQDPPPLPEDCLFYEWCRMPDTFMRSVADDGSPIIVVTKVWQAAEKWDKSIYRTLR